MLTLSLTHEIPVSSGKYEMRLGIAKTNFERGRDASGMTG